MVVLQLRRVSELVRPSAKPEGERNVLLEQIRSKVSSLHSFHLCWSYCLLLLLLLICLSNCSWQSFNLKPAAVAKPSMKGPPTNLKVAAILEKANAIRQVGGCQILSTLLNRPFPCFAHSFRLMSLEQAVAGSDEDDDGDSWSDS